MIARTSLFALAVVALAAASACAADKDAKSDKAEPAEAIVGKWWFPERNGKMEVYRDEDGKFFGKVIAYDKPDELDKNNPDPKLRTRKFIGITMLADFTYNTDDEVWEEGTIYDGDSGKIYNCKLWFEDGNLDELKARGFVGFSLFGRTETFYRVTKEEEAADAKKAAAAESATDGASEGDSAKDDK